MSFSQLFIADILMMIKYEKSQEIILGGSLVHTAWGCTVFSFSSTTSLKVVLLNSKTSCEDFWRMALEADEMRANLQMHTWQLATLRSYMHWFIIRMMQSAEVKSLLPIYRDVSGQNWAPFLQTHTKAKGKICLCLFISTNYTRCSCSIQKLIKMADLLQFFPKTYVAISKMLKQNAVIETPFLCLFFYAFINPSKSTGNKFPSVMLSFSTSRCDRWGSIPKH